MSTISDLTIAPRSACGCGKGAPGETPELDATVIPKAIRHPAIFGVLDSLKPGEAIVLKAPHRPLHLLRQIDERTPNAFEVTYLDEGPEIWRLQIARR